MLSAALLGLYNTTNRSSNVLFHDLTKTDIKLLVSISCRDPSLPSYWDDVKQQIQGLPHHLRSRSVSHTTPTLIQVSSYDDQDGMVRPGHLCKGHLGLNAQLMYDVWRCIRFEFDRGVGRTLYPVIMHGGLSRTQEQQVRQLEPVLRMWHRDFNVQGSTPPGKAPIDAGEKWAFQENACPACIVSRIGADKDVAYALLVGMVARYGSRRIGTRNYVQSRRVTLVEYWLKASKVSGRTLDEAWALGKEVRRLKECLRAHDKAGRRPGFDGFLTLLQAPEQGLNQPPVEDQDQSSALEQEQCLPERSSDIEIDISDPFNPSSNSNAKFNINSCLTPTASADFSSSCYSSTYNDCNHSVKIDEGRLSAQSLLSPLTDYQQRYKQLLSPHRPYFSTSATSFDSSTASSFADHPCTDNIAHAQEQLLSAPHFGVQFHEGTRVSLRSLQARLSTARSQWGDGGYAGEGYGDYEVDGGACEGGYNIDGEDSEGEYDGRRGLYAGLHPAPLISRSGREKKT